jgi:hypothetical protein
MKFSLTVDSPREAGYATSMFQALKAAMTAEPPPAASFHQTCVDGVSHTALTGFQDVSVNVSVPNGVTDVDDQDEDAGSETGTDATTAGGAAPTGKKRGRKSAEQKAAEAAAKAALEENALKPGAALQGVSAQSLAQALEAMPLVHEAGGVQVRTAPDTPPDEIAAMRERLQAQDAKIKAEEEAAAAAQAAKDAAKAATTVTVPAAVAEPPKPPADDDLLASLFAKKAAPVQQAEPTAGSRFASMAGPELRKAFIEYINGEGGLFWARAVMEHYKLATLDDLTDVQTREALENPARFKSAA